MDELGTEPSRRQPESLSRSSGPVHELVEHLFRHQASRLVASLTRSFGPAHLHLAEEVVQDALIQALKRWPFLGVPDQPAAWLYRVAHNLALDRLRRDSALRHREESIRLSLAPHGERDEPTEPFLPGEITDDQLRLIFLCCHPELPRDSRVALTLKTVGGFSVGEIARAFLTPGPTIAQRLVRAQRRIRERSLPFEVPPPDELPERLETVMEVLYLLFNEGYAASDGDQLIRADLCAEALRLTEHLARLPVTDVPEIHALAALLAFQSSRLGARLDGEGDLVLLADQDRTLWDHRLIARAFRHLERSAVGSRETPYHLQAVIAAHHATAESDALTDWPSILEAYNRLYALNPSPVVALNRAVALARVDGPFAGLEALEEISGHPALAGYHLLAATRGELLLKTGDRPGALVAYRRALEHCRTGPERRFLERKLRELAGPQPPS